MQSPKKIAVAGATGRVGHHVVDVLKAAGHDVVPMSRSLGVDVITGGGLAAALAGVECVIDTATGPSPEQEPATTFFTTAARNLQEAGQQAGVQRMVVVSIIGVDHSTGGYGAAKLAHEQAMLAGPVPALVLRAAQFHEFVPLLIEWGTQGDVAYVPRMRTQLVAARTVARDARRPGHRARAPALRAAVPRGGRAPRGKPRRDGHPARRAPGLPGQGRGRERPGRPGRAQRERRPAPRPGCHPGRPDFRGMAQRHVLTASQGSHSGRRGSAEPAVAGPGECLRVPFGNTNS